MRDTKLKELQEIKPVINGSLVQIARVCGNKNCKCAKGAKHKSYSLTRTINGKTRTVYVPKQMEEEIKLWVKERKRIKKVMEEVSDLQYVIIKKRSEERKARKKKLTNNKSSI